MVSMKTSEWENRKQSLNSSAENNTSRIAMFDIRQLRNTFFYFCKDIAVILLLSGFWVTVNKHAEKAPEGADAVQMFGG